MPFDLTPAADTAPDAVESTLTRPRLLVKAAQYGAQLYRRSRDLPGAVPGLIAQPVARILPKLRETEAMLDRLRRDGSAAYRPGIHVQVLAALLAEAAQTGA